MEISIHTSLTLHLVCGLRLFFQAPGLLWCLWYNLLFSPTSLPKSCIITSHHRYANQAINHHRHHRHANHHHHKTNHYTWSSKWINILCFACLGKPKHFKRTWHFPISQPVWICLQLWRKVSCFELGGEHTNLLLKPETGGLPLSMRPLK